MGTFSIWHWLIVLVIVMLLFGTKKLGNIGADLGKAIKGFKDGLKHEDSEEGKNPLEPTRPTHLANDSTTDTTVDVRAKEKK